MRLRPISAGRSFGQAQREVRLNGLVYIVAPVYLTRLALAAGETLIADAV